MSEPVIRVQDITRVYTTGDVEMRALNGVSLTVERGDVASTRR